MIEEWEKAVAAWAAGRGMGKGVQATYRGSPGGFGSRSFSLWDGSRKLHLKLCDAEHAPGLRRWAAVHDLLEARYLAPPLLEVIEGGILPGDACGLVFAHVEGEPLVRGRAPAVLPAVVEALRRLHGDGELAARLGPAPAATCADVLRRVYIRRFREDLAIIRDRLPPFVPAALCEWMSAETDRLEAAAAAHPAFGEPAAAVVHGDPWWHNVLVSPHGRATIIDWDGLSAAGDPALDFSILLWPLLRAGERQRWYASPRLPVYERAALLDEVIDTLADWVEAGSFRRVGEASRRRTRALHREALSLYRRRYP